MARCPGGTGDGWQVGSVGAGSRTPTPLPPLFEGCASRKECLYGLVRRGHGTAECIVESVMHLGSLWPSTRLLLFIPLLLLFLLLHLGGPGQVITHMRQILYGCDVYSMYQQSAIAAGKYNERTSRARKAQEISTMVSAGALVVEDQEVTLDGVVASAFLEHFRSVVTGNGPGVYYTGPLPLNSRRLSVAEAMGPEAHRELNLHCLPPFMPHAMFQQT